MTDLAVVRGRVRGILEDENGLNYTNGQVDEACRQALRQYRISHGSLAVLKDLDGAAATTIAAEDVAAFVMGAAAFAAHGKAAGRVLQYDLNQAVDDTLLEWAKHALNVYRDNLRDIKRRMLRTAVNPPYSAVDDGFGNEQETRTW